MISIVIPLYNKAHTIKRTLGSVLAQTFENFEVVIIDDGSTDNGIDVIEQFTSDERVKIIRQNNQGVSVARNEGVKNSKFDYVAFLDGDDEWLPEYLEHMHKAIEKYPDAGFICGAGKVTSGGKEYIRLAEKYKEQITLIDFFENPHVFVHTSATIVSKKIFNKTYGFPPGMKRNQDYALFFAVALLTETVYCGFPLSIYVGDVEGQATTKPFEEVMQHVIKRYNLVYETWLKQGKKNKNFIVFMKYELRHTFLFLINQNKYDVLTKFTLGLDKGIMNQFSSIEKHSIKNKGLKSVAKGIIYISKIRWRLRGFPRLQY